MSFSSSTDSNSSTRTASSMSSMSSGQTNYSSPQYQNQRQRSPSYTSQEYGATRERATMSPSASSKSDNMQRYVIINQVLPSICTQNNRLTNPHRTGSRYICMVGGCESNFSRSADLNRHYTTVHFPDPARLDCPKPRCSRKGDQGFTRQDHLTEHLRQYHGDQLPKRTSSKSKSTSTSQRTAKYVR